MASEQDGWITVYEGRGKPLDWREWTPETVEECAQHTKALIDIAVECGPRKPVDNERYEWDPVVQTAYYSKARAYCTAARALGIL